MPQESLDYTDYEYDKNWTANDLVQWINVTLGEPDVDSVEIFKKSRKMWLRVHYKG